jgi:8-oxo-dGTP pyrophosphatase MutT (NUDIX family)
VVAEARPAATVILLRDGMAGLETFLMRRATTMAFAPRMHVYPGGKVDEADYSVPIVLATTEAGVAVLAARASIDPAGLRALYSCAIREVAEETGVVLAEVGPDGVLLVDTDLIPLADHWVTPESERLRYDVRFFIAALPAGQEARLTTSEADGAFWVTPADALAGMAAGSMAMLPPTEQTLRFLGDFAVAADAIAAAAGRDVIPLLPRRILGEDGSARWVMVNDRTDEIVTDAIFPPHTHETDGTRRSAEPR